MLKAGLALALCFGPGSTRLIVLGGALRARRGFPGRIARCDTRHSERVCGGRHGRIGLGYGFDFSPWQPRSACVRIGRRNCRPSVKFIHEPSHAVGEAGDVEMQRIVVAVADTGIDGGMERRNEPMLGPRTGDDVKERQPIILRGGEARIGALRVVAPPAPGFAAPRLDELDMEEEPLQGASEIRRLLEPRFAPGNGKIVIEQHPAGAIDDNVSLAPAIRALELTEIVELGADVDVGGKGPMSVIRSAGIVDDEVARRRGIRFVVMRARHRLPEISGEIPLEILFREEGAQRLPRRQPAILSDASGERGRQAFQRRREIPGRVHAAHQALGLCNRIAGIAQSLRVEGAGAHTVHNKGRPEMIWFAGAPGRAGGGARHRTGQYGPDTRAQARQAADCYRNGHGSSQCKTPYYRDQCALCQAVSRMRTMNECSDGSRMPAGSRRVLGPRLRGDERIAARLTPSPARCSCRRMCSPRSWCPR